METTDHSNGVNSWLLPDEYCSESRQAGFRAAGTVQAEGAAPHSACPVPGVVRPLLRRIGKGNGDSPPGQEEWPEAIGGHGISQVSVDSLGALVLEVSSGENAA